MVEQRGVEPLGSALRTRVSWFHRLLHVPIYLFNSTKQPSEEYPQSIDSYSFPSIALRSRQSDAKIKNTSFLAIRLHTTDSKSGDSGIT